jgi:hypothetical protein
MAGPVNGGQALNPNANSGTGAPMAQKWVNGFKVTNINAATPTCTFANPQGVVITPVLNTAQPIGDMFGDVWGSYGGGYLPVGASAGGSYNGGYIPPSGTPNANAGNGFTQKPIVNVPVPGPTSWAPPIEQTLGAAETAADFTFGQMNASANQGQPVLVGLSNASLPGQTVDTMYADENNFATADSESIFADTQL